MRDHRTMTAVAKPMQYPPGIFDGYHVEQHSDAHDEMFDRVGRIRQPYRGVHKGLMRMGVGELVSRSDALSRAFIDQGITFSLSGQERPFPLDLVPRVIAASEWSLLERVSNSG